MYMLQSKVQIEGCPLQGRQYVLPIVLLLVGQASTILGCSSAAVYPSELVLRGLFIQNLVSIPSPFTNLPLVAFSAAEREPCCWFVATFWSVLSAC